MEQELKIRIKMDLDNQEKMALRLVFLRRNRN